MALTSSRSELSNLQTNKTKRLYRLPTRFYGYQLLVLIALAVVFTWLSRNEALTDGSPAFGMTRQRRASRCRRTTCWIF
jgi:hypothetical protein